MVKKILMLTKYGEKGASSRLRAYQYVPRLRDRGWEVEISCLFPDEYLDNSYAGRRIGKIAHVIRAYFHRAKALCSVGTADLIWIQNEVFPYFPPLVERLLSSLDVPYVVDYDDAIFHRYDMSRNRFIRSLLSTKIDAVMRLSSLVVVCNEYLAERARAAGALNVVVVPTVVDTKKYRVIAKDDYAERRYVTIGWIGSPSTAAYLETLRPVLERLRKRFLLRFIVVGGVPKGWEDLEWVEVLPWDEETESRLISTFDIGVMPLDNTPWERGKCGYKIIQYMACGIPVVASSVGVNPKLVNGCGLLASTLDEWETSLRRLILDARLRSELGERGRRRVESCYSLCRAFPIVENALDRVRSGAVCLT